MDEKDLLIEKLQNELKEEKERNEILLNKIQELTLENVALAEKIMGYN
jgi:hypothetical protein